MTVDREGTLKAWQARGFRGGGLWVDPPGQVWEDFVHAEDELFMVVEGDMELTLAGRVQRPQPGEEILIPARTLHTVRNLGSGTARWLYAYKR
jgi:cupin 2 domain-containing protein